jgi:hypothetical protein
MTVLSRRAGVVVCSEAHYDVLTYSRKSSIDRAAAVTRGAMRLLQAINNCRLTGEACGNGCTLAPECQCKRDLETLVRNPDAAISSDGDLAKTKVLG